MTIPRLTIRRDKLTSYLLDVTSERGASKAKFFIGRGFACDGWMALVEAIGRHGADHWPGRAVVTPYGVKHVLVGPMPCPDGTSPDVLSVWMVSRDGTDASLVTAYPAP